jgi:acyl dehydratase
MQKDGVTRLFLEDLLVGQKFVSRTYALDAEQIKQFAADYDPQPFHLDESAAQATFFGGLAASGWHTAAITMRLAVETVPLAGGLIGAGGELNWPKPTRPDDVLQVEIEVLSISPSRSRPEWGNAVIGITTRNQHGEVVQTFNVKTLLARRSAALA